MKNWKRYASQTKIISGTRKVFSLTPEQEFELIDIAEKLPIEWHKTTPRNFQCEPHCCYCCTMCWFNMDEIIKLPKKYHKGLNEIYGTFYPRTIKSKCYFYQKKKDLHCLINKYRPLRCKIYPYFPILDLKNDRIVILAQDIMVWGGNPPQEPASLCYGLGHGPDVSKVSEKLCREYLIHSINEQSHSRFLWMGTPEEFIDKRALSCRENPLYKTFAECDSNRRKKVFELDEETFRNNMQQGIL